MYYYGNGVSGPSISIGPRKERLERKFCRRGIGLGRDTYYVLEDDPEYYPLAARKQQRDYSRVLNL